MREIAIGGQADSFSYLSFSPVFLIKKYLITGGKWLLTFLRPKLAEIEYKNSPGRELAKIEQIPCSLAYKGIIFIWKSAPEVSYYQIYIARIEEVFSKGFRRFQKPSIINLIEGGQSLQAKRARAISIAVSSPTVYFIDHMALGMGEIQRFKQRVYLLGRFV